MSDKLEQIQLLGKHLEELDATIASSEEALSVVKENRRKIACEVLPEIMEQLGLEEIRLQTGKKITLKSMVTSKIKDEPQAFAWLHDNNHESIIKNEYKINLRAGEDTDQVESALAESGVPYTQKLSVNPQTLKKFVRERLEEGDNIPYEAFGIYEYKEVDFKE